MKSIQEQIGGRCKHFTGMMSKVCKCGINYGEAFGERPVMRMPCIKDRMPHLSEAIIPCYKLEFPTKEEVDIEVEEGNKGIVKMLSALSAAKKHHRENKTLKATIKCPNGDHELTYMVAENNGHFWLGCKDCDIKMME